MLIATGFGGELLAELTLPHVFSDHMVLQRDCKAAIWGGATPGAEVTVAFKGKGARTLADKNGKWKVHVGTGKQDSAGAELTIVGDGGIRTLRDVLVGEVWFASGQSNMGFTMNRVPDYESVIEKAEYPLIRMFNAPLVTAVDPQNDIEGQWTACSPATAGGYSAVAFFFARKLHRELGVPVGIIKSAWGGKPVETFTSREALNTLPATKALVDATLTADETYDPTQAQRRYQVRMEQWKTAIAAWRKNPVSERGRSPRKPVSPKRPLDTEGKPGVLFNSMIHPFIGYTLRGAIWYQGEGNAKPGAVPYDQSLPLMIRDWRRRWNDEFSFYFVQLANFRTPTVEPGNNDPWPLLQDRMRLILKSTPKTGMAIINDVGEANDIHPKNKHDVGERLARWALAKDYGRDIVYSGPLYQKSLVKNGVVEVTFEHVGDGLDARDGEKLKRFEIAGADQVWRWADAKIVSTNIVHVSSDTVQKPVAVRYAWAANPEGANLVNSERLPASVFRTDTWADVIVEGNANAAAEATSTRRTLANEIKAIAARKATLERDSIEFKELAAKQRKLLDRFRATKPRTKK